MQATEILLSFTIFMRKCHDVPVGTDIPMRRQNTASIFRHYELTLTGKKPPSRTAFPETAAFAVGFAGRQGRYDAG